MIDTTGQSAHTRVLPRIRLEHLWLALALSTIAVFISMAPTVPNDYWWHLKVGEIVATEGLPTTNRFAWTVPNEEPFVYQSWLGEWLFYMLYTIGGHPLVIFTRNVLGIVTFTLVAIEAQRRSGAWRVAALVTVIAAAMTINNLTTRTQNWSWLPFMLVFTLLSRYSDGQLPARWLLVLPLTMAFWVNVHGAFVLGLMLVGAFVVGETLRRLLKQPRALTVQRLRWLYVTTAAMALATLVNPIGVGVYSYVSALLNDNAIQSLIVEWQPPAPRSIAERAFFGSVLLVIAAFAFARRRPTITDVLLVCGLAWQAFGSVRHVIWFGLVAMPIVAQVVSAPRPLFAAALSERERGAGGVANTLVVALLLSFVLAVQPWTKHSLPLPQEYRAQFADLPGAPQLFTSGTPYAAAEHLRADPCRGRLFNEMGYGSYLVWALYPQTQIFIDPRIELYPFELWQKYIAINRGDDLAARLERFNISCVLLDREIQPALAAQMEQLPGWQRSFNDTRSEVWRR
ncbi:hypothetical protein HC891_09170 [Candidatus Gracilibacteria bacterium]|nr:hypothetical protein [Candidatus Gracilibacteria bacterium]